MQINKDANLISIRNINTIAILDQTTLKVKWALKDYTRMQHSPKQGSNGNIVIYDNWGNITAKSPFTVITRIIELDPRSLQTKWTFPEKYTPKGITTLTGSNLQTLQNNNILACLNNQGIIEISPAKEIVWHLQFPVIFAKRYMPLEVPFLKTL